MANTDYLYAAARIRSKEMQCFNAAMLEQLMACKSYESLVRLLGEKGWGTGSPNQTPESLLAGERNRTWAELRELVEDMRIFDVFLLANDYHNLKAAIKNNYAPAPDADIYNPNGTIDPDVFSHAVEENDFSALPEKMAETGKKALSALRETGDGQLCDILIDHDALIAIREAGRESDCELLDFYAEHTVLTANIKAAVRCRKTGKSLDFVSRVLAPCDSLDVSLLAKAAVDSVEAICVYLRKNGLEGAADALENSPSAFERWCDNRLMEKIRPQKYVTSSVSPLAAWLLARENEIKTVRIILSGKKNELADEAIRERLREMYV